MRWLLLLVVGSVVSAACSSDADYAGAGVGAGGLGGASGGGGGAAGRDGAAGDGADGTAGTSGNLVTGVRVFSGTARMLFNGPSCTNEEGATGDRWCAFITYTDASMQTRSLYAFNASRVAAGADVKCGPGDATTSSDCLLLTANLQSDSASPVLHGTFFQGNSLVYYQPLSAQSGFAPYVWRPGMTKGRLLATFAAGEDAVYCTPAPQGTAVVCVLLPDAVADPNPTVGFADLLIGKADGATEPLLSVADNVVIFTAEDVGFRPTFGFGFPAGPGDHVAWTTRDGATGPQTLRLQRAGDAASKTTIASDVDHWNVSRDGSRWFWLSATMGTGIGTLQSAPFPSGANPIDLHADVADYDVSAATGKPVVALTKDGALVAIPDPTTPTGQLTLDTQVKVLLSVSGAAHVAYVKNRLGTNQGDLYVKTADGKATCVVEPTRPVAFRSVSFAPDAGAILWAHLGDDGFEAHYTRLADCATMPVATDITLLESVGHERVLFMDTFDDLTISGTMRFRAVGNGNTLTAEAPIPIADHVDSYAITGPTPDMLLYTVNAGGENDGVYVRWFSD
ncbi:MAG TPA: hypothetical protein VN903_06970 [Polyangia bacterium]|jgi:hypothetical protein|nr:hypothetical protein [Polyangia bacterium]